MAKTDPLDPNVPASTESPRMGDERIRALARAVAELLNVDHYMGNDGGAGTGYNEDAAGEHKQVKFNAPISTPTNEADKMFIYGKDVGGKIELHCLDEDGNEIQLTTAGKLYSNSGLLIPSGQIATIETVQAVDSTGIILKNDGGDTVITVGDDGTATLANSSQLASSVAPTADADIANKKYVDDQISLIDSIFGTWTSTDSDSNPLTKNAVYKVTSDGFVYLGMASSSSPTLMYTDGSNPPTTVRMRNYTTVWHNNSTWGGTPFPLAVRKNDYWKIDGGASPIYWLPIGSGECQKQT